MEKPTELPESNKICSEPGCNEKAVLKEFTKLNWTYGTGLPDIIKLFYCDYHARKNVEDYSGDKEGLHICANCFYGPENCKPEPFEFPCGGFTEKN